MSPTAIQKAEEEAFTQVNSLLLKDLNTRVKACPSRDMTDLLEHKAKTYPGLWKTFPEASMQSTAENFHHSDATSVVDERAKFLVPINAAIVQLLSATVIKEALEGSDEGLSAIIEGLNKFVTMSEVIWHLGSTAVLGLTPALVMKVGNDIDLEHLPTLDYIKQHASRVPIPDIQGILQQPDTKRVFLLMSRELASRWIRSGNS